nr:uncharacterized protein LOC117609914 [Osmia lignaria]
MLRSVSEYYNMLFIYAQCNGNAELAAERYRETYGVTANAPIAPCFQRLATRVYATGSLMPDRIDTGRSTRSSASQEELVLAEFEQDNTTSTREISRRSNVSPSNVYKYVPVRNLRPQDFIRRMRYSRWLLGKIEHNPSFCTYVLWTDEALFTHEGCFTTHTAHVWSDEDLHMILPRAAQHRWSVNVWAGICGDFVVGPYILPDKLDGPAYNQFLQHVLPNLLEVIPLEIRKNMYYQHDEAPAHYAANVRAHLNETFQDRWIGRGGPVAWPPQSPDMNPVDFYLWGHLRNEVYRQHIKSREEAVARIHAVVKTISVETLRKVQRNVASRAATCFRNQGGFIELL